jgi:TfoX/Sxy family transcriptional regulator of competence genes
MGMKPRFAYDRELAERVRIALGPVGVSERKMFGGLCFMVNGHMAVGIVNDKLMVRVGKDSWEETLALPHAGVMDFTGRPMKGFVYVAPAGLKTAAGLKAWAERGAGYARSLPPK